MYLSQIDHLDHAMTQTMANRPRTEVKVGLFYLAFTFICVVDSDKTKSDNAGHLLVVNILFYILFSWIAFTLVSSQYLLSMCATAMIINRKRFT